MAKDFFMDDEGVMHDQGNSIVPGYDWDNPEAEEDDGSFIELCDCGANLADDDALEGEVVMSYKGRMTESGFAEVYMDSEEINWTCKRCHTRIELDDYEVSE